MVKATRRQFLGGVAAGGVGVALVSCNTVGTPAPSAAVKPKRGGTVTLANSFDIGNIDPTTGTGSPSAFFVAQVHDPLVAADRNLKLVPALAERWEISGDQKTITLFLRKGVTYHDGTAFDAASVKWNMDRHLTHPKSGLVSALAPVASVDVVDASTVAIALKAPNSPFMQQLAQAAGRMSSRKEVESQGDAFGSKVHKAGSGPFMLQEIVTNDHVTLVRNPNWWGRDQFNEAMPYLDQVIIRYYADSAVRFTNVRTGNAQVIYDIARGDLALADAEPSLVVKSIPGTAFHLLIANHKPGFTFSEPRYVKAVAMALDRAELVKVAYENTGKVVYGPVSAQLFAFDPNFKPYEKVDIDGAKRLIAQVGKGPLKFELLYISGDAAALQAYQLIQAQLKKADIEVTLKGLPTAQALTEFGTGAFAGMIATNSGGAPDPDTNVVSFVHTTGRNNPGKYSNAEVDKLIADEQSTTDETKRRDAFRRIEQIVVVDDPAHVWYQNANTYIVHATAVKGLEPHPTNRPTFETTWLDK